MSAEQLTPALDERLLPASQMVHDSLFTSRSCLVTVSGAEQASLLSRDILQIRGGFGGRGEGRLGVLFMSAQGLFYGGERSTDKTQASLNTLESFANEGVVDEKLIVIKGMDAKRRTDGGRIQLVESLANMINQPNKPMVLALCTGAWCVPPQSAEYVPGDPGNVIRQFHAGIELDSKGVASSYVTEPREFTMPRADVFKNIAASAPARTEAEIEVPLGYSRL